MTNYVNGQSTYRCGGTNNNIAKALASKEGWNTYTNNCVVGNDLAANNATGFSAVPVGNYYDSSFGNAGNDAYFWSATRHKSVQVIAYYRALHYSSASVVSNSSNKGSGFSVRCLRD